MGDAVATICVSDSTVVKADESVVSCELAGGAALLDLRSGTYYSLNSVGARVWDLIREPQTLASIRTHLVASYDVHPNRCYEDIVVVLDQMANAGLVKVTDGTAS